MSSGVISKHGRAGSASPGLLGFARPAAFTAAIVAFLLTAVTPPIGFLVGLVALGVLGVGLARRKTNLSVVIAAGVLSYLGIWLVGSIVDPSAPSSGSGSSAPQIPWPLSGNA